MMPIISYKHPYFKKLQLLINVNFYSFLCATVYCLILIFLFHCEVFITIFRICHTLTHSSYHLPIAIYLTVLIHLIIKEIDIDPDNDSDNRGHGRFRPGTVRKRRKTTTSIQIMTNERREILS